MSTQAKANRRDYALLPLRRGVLLPGSSATIPVGRKRSIRTFEDVRPGDRIVVASQLEPGTGNPVLADLHSVAVRATVRRILRSDDGSLRVLLEGHDRVRLESIEETDPGMRVKVKLLDDGPVDNETQALVEALAEHVRELAEGSGGSLDKSFDAGDPAGLMADKIAGALSLEQESELEVLSTVDVAMRVRLVTRLVQETRDMWQLRSKVEGEVRKRLGKHQRDAILRERIRVLQDQLEDGDGGDDGKLKALKERLAEANLPEDARKAADRELERLDKLPDGHPEASVARKYLELIADIPWDARVEAKDDLNAVEAKLEADHFGLGDVKERILEHMAVLKLSGSTKGTILCLAGPPGVGKTSLGQSIADATGRPFVRIALGGVRDEAELRGHRRTYVGALPGRIVKALTKAGVKNPVILLDEIDKLGAGWAGRPEDALLEILDPEQNHTFTDHYLELELDLSEVMFVATANQLSNLSAPLRDRLEIIEVSGYTPDEKVQIAQRHLLPRKLEEHALPEDSLKLDDGTLRKLITDYTREAGVRQLGRELGRLCRSVALDVARADEEKAPAVRVDEAGLEDRLGKQRFFNEVAERTSVPGVATGLAWTPVGGDILFIETSRMPGKGRVEITGQLGDVMKESARAALTYVRSNADALGVDATFLEEQDIHIHVPAGAVPKDGPSAGVTMFAALTSLLTGRRVRPDTGMTGEATLRGRVMPVGGIKAKVLAAHRAGLTRVVMPAKNRRDIDEVPEEVRKSMDIHFVDDMADALELVLEPADAELESVSPLPSASLGERGRVGPAA